MNRNGYETELLAAKVAVEAAKENRFVTELEDKSSQVEKNENVIFFMETNLALARSTLPLQRILICSKTSFLISSKWQFWAVSDNRRQRGAGEGFGDPPRLRGDSQG